MKVNTIPIPVGRVPDNLEDCLGKWVLCSDSVVRLVTGINKTKIYSKRYFSDSGLSSLTHARKGVEELFINGRILN